MKTERELRLKETIETTYRQALDYSKNNNPLIGTQDEWAPLFHALFNITMLSKKELRNGIQQSFDWNDSQADDFVNEVLASIQSEYLPYHKMTYLQRMEQRRFLKETAKMFFNSNINSIYDDSLRNHTIVKDSELMSVINEISKTIKIVYKFTPLKLYIKWTNNDVDKFVDNIKEKIIKKHIN
jgi:hypothetical protein